MAKKLFMRRCRGSCRCVNAAAFKHAVAGSRDRTQTNTDKRLVRASVKQRDIAVSMQAVIIGSETRQLLER
ncbi:hypothetical protein F4V91_26640 [Neorhizobium galegae]|uniref:Uncharacterized protein n=1 Tax=Neorhizobium galegae TaxID=399 RepID=A0A6A1TMF8_NEOGA|nr:hypothetical protein [Neorhizobium galegae]KAB1083179.1 hypothetical protein F4V91_26640 [Neorhizobium galegae]